jgi:hypothetical protein
MVTRVKSFDGSRKANTTAIVAYKINEGKMKQSIRLYSLISLSLLMLPVAEMNKTYRLNLSVLVKNIKNKLKPKKKPPKPRQPSNCRHDQKTRQNP